MWNENIEIERVATNDAEDPVEAVPPWGNPSSDHNSINRLYSLWAGKEGLSGNTFCFVQIEVVVAVRQVQ